jgi:hypothetical protein
MGVGFRRAARSLGLEGCGGGGSAGPAPGFTLARMIFSSPGCLCLSLTAQAEMALNAKPAYLIRLVPA